MPGATVAACNNNTVLGCIPPPPQNNSRLTASVAAAPAGVTTHALSPAVTLDGWNVSSLPFWGRSSYLALDLEDSRLLALAASLSPGILRLGGSPEDSILFDDDGSCVAGTGGDGPAPDYYCSQVKPYIYGCLTRARWFALLAFAASTNLSIVLGLNGCTGRMSADGAMDVGNVRALLEATAASPHAASLVGLELSNEVLVNTITPRAWGADVVRIKALAETVLGRSLAFAGPDDASPAHLALALNNTPPSVLSALTYHHYPGCLANATDYFALDPTCLKIIDEWGTMFSIVGAARGVPTWAGETAEHGGGGVTGLTDTFTSSLYYTYQLGTLPLHGVELTARQTMVGGLYELIDHDTFTPNPDYWIIYFFKALIGGGARAFPVELSANVSSSGVRVFCFSASAASGAARAVLALSLNTVGARIDVVLEGAGMGGPRVEYVLTGDLAAPHGAVSCNGVKLEVGVDGAPPSVRGLGVAAAAGSPMVLAGASVVFATL